MHTPVLLEEAIEALQIKQGEKYIDATAGEGGHLREIVQKGGVALGVDWDQNQVDKLVSSGLKVVQGNYANVEQIAKENEFHPVKGVLFDLGLSMEQLNSSKRGFSYKNLDEPLDMRIGDGTETAADLLNTLNADVLYEVFAKYSEELDSRVIADTIVNKRKFSSLETVGDLVKVVKESLKNCQQHHQHSLNRTLSRIFQAVRIVVNDEFENIRQGLSGAVNITEPNGRVVIITFHSLEDRIVKQFIRSRQLHSEEIVRGDRELSFERSATLRIITV